jgi:hypothetical protein
MTSPEGTSPNSGRTFQSAEALAGLAQSSERSLPTRIERTDLIPRTIESDGTEIVLQRHGRYERGTDGDRVGSLTEEAVATERQTAVDYFDQLLDQLPEGERSNIDVLFLASDTQYAGGGRRSLETAQLAQEAAVEVFARRGLPATNIVNLDPAHHIRGEGGPRPTGPLREPQMFDKSPDFVAFLKDKYGDLNTDFWIAFEEDREREARLAMGAEGPDEIAGRMARSVEVMARYASAYHAAKPGRRLVIWADTHYDTISPYVKREILGVGKETPLQVDYGAGVAIDIDRSGRAKTHIANQEYPVRVTRET